MNKKVEIVICALLIFGMLSMATIGTLSYFNDLETSSGNTLTAGTLDLTINGLNGVNSVVFNVINFRPGNQPTGTFVLGNIGSISGTLSISSITVTNNENGRTEPEIAAGDTTDGVGELGSMVGIYLFVDNAPVTGWRGFEDPILYNGMIDGLPSSIPIGTLGAGATTNIQAIVNWWSTANDNLAQSDSCTIDFTFSLVQ